MRHGRKQARGQASPRTGLIKGVFQEDIVRGWRWAGTVVMGDERLVTWLVGGL